MKLTKDFFAYGFTSAIFGLLTYMTLTGSLQRIIHFAGSLNELGFAVLCFMMTMITGLIALASLKPSKKGK